MTEARDNKLSAVEPWDPLRENISRIEDSYRLQIENILDSYTGFYDVFSELIQNSLDALERRWDEEPNCFEPHIWIKIDLQSNVISVTDNGCGMSYDEFRSFLQPNCTFKRGLNARGSKGVGITYLAYGFNWLEVATKSSREMYSGLIENGKRWVTGQTDESPKVKPHDASHAAFLEIDRGASITLRLVGDGIRPKDLGYFGAETASQWFTVLRVKTPLGGIYLADDSRPMSYKCTVESVRKDGEVTIVEAQDPEYVFPHTEFDKVANLHEYIRWLLKAAQSGKDTSNPPRKFQKLNGVWAKWNASQIVDNDTVFDGMRLDDSEINLIRSLNVQLYFFLGYSIDLWDDFNDRKLELRRGSRVLKGGLQLATKHMPQGSLEVIHLTRNIGNQNNAHVVIHADAKPDMGRKGFQPEFDSLAQKLASRAVGQGGRRFWKLLRRKTGEPTFQEQMKLHDWIERQKTHARESPLTIEGKGLFMPAEVLPILSTPIVEQDVVALFNQMLASGIVRGIRILSSSTYKQYDGLYQVVIDIPTEKYVRSQTNPLGVDPEQIRATGEAVVGFVQVLEYKYNLDALFEEFTTSEKRAEDIGLVVSWHMGTRWQRHFEVTSYLHPDTRHHRPFHGYTHGFTHANSGYHAFHAIVLEDLINYLTDQTDEEERQKRLYSDAAY